MDNGNLKKKQPPPPPFDDSMVLNHSYWPLYTVKEISYIVRGIKYLHTIDNFLFILDS